MAFLGQEPMLVGGGWHLPRRPARGSPPPSPRITCWLTLAATPGPTKRQHAPPNTLLPAADVVLWPDRSIIKQSYDARERLQDPSLPLHLGFGNLNGDGFGIGWYAASQERREQDPTPCMFKSVTPAWWVLYMWRAAAARALAWEEGAGDG